MFSFFFKSHISFLDPYPIQIHTTQQLIIKRNKGHSIINTTAGENKITSKKQNKDDWKKWDMKRGCGAGTWC
jgi:hypothetical protein